MMTSLRVTLETCLVSELDICLLVYIIIENIYWCKECKNIYTNTWRSEISPLCTSSLELWC